MGRTGKGVASHHRQVGGIGRGLPLFLFLFLPPPLPSFYEQFCPKATRRGQTRSGSALEPRGSHGSPEQVSREEGGLPRGPEHRRGEAGAVWESGVQEGLPASRAADQTQKHAEANGSRVSHRGGREVQIRKGGELERTLGQDWRDQCEPGVFNRDRDGIVHLHEASRASRRNS